MDRASDTQSSAWPVAGQSFADSEFNESDHPRASDGKFGSGSVSSTKLSAREKTFISSYTGDDFLKTNTALRSGDTSGSSIKTIDEVIGRSELPSGTKLYRGMSKEAAKALFGGTINKDDVISDKAFLSTSKDVDIVKSSYGFGGVVLEITTGEGQKGLDVSDLSRNEHEKEVLLPRDSKFKVSGIVAPKKPGDPVIVKVSTA